MTSTTGKSINSNHNKSNPSSNKAASPYCFPNIEKSTFNSARVSLRKDSWSSVLNSNWTCLRAPWLSGPRKRPGIRIQSSRPGMSSSWSVEVCLINRPLELWKMASSARSLKSDLLWETKSDSLNVDRDLSDPMEIRLRLYNYWLNATFWFRAAPYVLSAALRTSRCLRESS